jgi:voltage-gated potassium channel
MYETFNKHIYRLLLAAVIFMITTGTIFYHFVEHFRWLDAYYFCVVTLATVGYGDLVPRTDAGKIFTTFYVLAGVGIVATFFSYSVRRRAFKHEGRHKQPNKK